MNFYEVVAVMHVVVVVVVVLVVVQCFLTYMNT